MNLNLIEMSNNTTKSLYDSFEVLFFLITTKIGLKFCFKMTIGTTY
jgi:hypothetical protein